MAMTFFYAGLKQLEKFQLGILSPTLYVGLYDNNVSLSNTNVFADFNLNSLSGGDPIALAPATWVDTSASPNSEWTYSGLTWIFDPYAGGTTIYGYILYDYSTSVAIWADVFGAGYSVPSSGGGIVLQMVKDKQRC